MFFELNGKTYRVKFHRVGTTTLAELFAVETTGFVHLGIIGTAYLHKNDRFVKSIGRKVALASLLAGISDEEYGLFPLSREDRRMIWEKYFETHKK